LLKADLELWCKLNSPLFASFLTTKRGHAIDDKLPAKVQLITQIIEGGAAPVPSWKEKDQAILAQLLDYMAGVEETQQSEMIERILSKLEQLTSSKAALADAL
jgi:aromatic ring hydroxylase